MPAKLFCKTGQLAGASYEIEEGAKIGTKPENDIVLYPKIISGKHARISWDGKNYFLQDLKSRNGTKLDGERITEEEKLDRLHVITFANSLDFIFQVVESLEKPVEKTMIDESFQTIPDLASGSKTGEQLFSKNIHKTIPEEGLASIPEIQEKPSQASDEQKTVVRAEGQPSRDLNKAAKRFQLRIESLGRTFELKEGENIIGRAIESEICIDDPSISRRHACLSLKSNVIKIKDFGSKNHTYIANEKINSEIKIKEGAEIRLGEVKAKLLLVND